jgi:hypothetical protein
MKPLVQAWLGIKTTKCKQTPPSRNEKGFFLFITLFVGNDRKPETLHYFPLLSVYVACTTILSNKRYSVLATRSGPEFICGYVDTTQLTLLYPYFVVQINYIVVSELTINFQI